MAYRRHITEPEPVTRRTRRARAWESDAGGEAAGGGWSFERADAAAAGNDATDGLASSRGNKRTEKVDGALAPLDPHVGPKHDHWLLKRGHAVSYVGLFLFTAVLYFRPYEYFPGVVPHSTAFWLATVTLVIFFPSQLALEGTLTARPREVNLLLLLCVAALLSIPLAINRGEAWDTFTTFLKTVLMFIVIVNAVRTEGRLKRLLLLALAVSCFLSLGALNDYRLGNLSVEGYRVKGVIGGMFDNPNDLALHLVTIVPVAVALGFSTRNPLKKILYGAGAFLMVATIVVTFSRGGFLGLACAGAVLAWRISHRHRLGIAIVFLMAVALFLGLAPGQYGGRMASIVNPSLDPLGSASARWALFIKSIIVSLANPVFGIGMGNFHIVSIHEQVSHNAFTQVAAEMGIAACVFYTMFIVTPLKRLRQIERETFVSRPGSRFYYLAVGLQASLIGYMVSSFFASVAYHWYIYYLVGYAVSLRRLYEAETGAEVGAAARGGDGEGLQEADSGGSAFGEPEAAHGQVT